MDYIPHRISDQITRNIRHKLSYIKRKGLERDKNLESFLEFLVARKQLSDQEAQAFANYISRNFEGAVSYVRIVQITKIEQKEASIASLK